MPDRDVQAILDMIHYEYAKTVARRAFRAKNGKAAKRGHYGYIKNTFRQLQSGKKTWSEIAREDRQLLEAEKECAYCMSPLIATTTHPSS